MQYLDQGVTKHFSPSGVYRIQLKTQANHPFSMEKISITSAPGLETAFIKNRISFQARHIFVLRLALHCISSIQDHENRRDLLQIIHSITKWWTAVQIRTSVLSRLAGLHGHHSQGKAESGRHSPTGLRAGAE